MTKREKAADVNRLGLELKEQGRLNDAARLLRKAAALDPSWDAPLYNLALLYKHQKRWKQALKYNREATALNPGNDAAWWNLGIAATALGQWDLARQAWRSFGIEVPDGEGPIDFPCGFGPIRLAPDGDAEVVWAYRLDPARAELASIPFPESGHRWRDVVLNDGAPCGYRQFRGQEGPVFNALQLLEASPFGTYVARVTMPAEGQAAGQLAEIAARLEGSAEDWSTSVRILCKACSEGRPHGEHDREATPPAGQHLVGIAARNCKHATAILAQWEAEAEGVHVESPDCALAPGPSR
jgi:tetratricopeptide (TPR) repeat protein